MSSHSLHAHIARHRQQAQVNVVVGEALGDHHGIAWADLVLFDLLHAAGGRLSSAQAAADLGVTPAQLLRQVLPLEKRGLLARPKADNGTRGLALSSAGTRLLREASATASEALTSLGVETG